MQAVMFLWVMLFKPAKVLPSDPWGTNNGPASVSAANYTTYTWNIYSHLLTSLDVWRLYHCLQLAAWPENSSGQHNIIAHEVVWGSGCTKRNIMLLCPSVGNQCYTSRWYTRWKGTISLLNHSRFKGSFYILLPYLLTSHTVSIISLDYYGQTLRWIIISVSVRLSWEYPGEELLHWFYRFILSFFRLLPTYSS